MTPDPTTSSRDKQSRAGIAAAALCIVTVLGMACGWIGGAFESQGDVPTPYLKQALIAFAVSGYAGLFAIGFGVYGVLQRRRKRAVAAWALAISLVSLCAYSLVWLQHLEKEATSERQATPKLRPRPLQ